MPPLDYFGARYYGSSLGRFLTPDWSVSPEAVPYANVADPQSLNLFAYVGNNPVTSADTNGHAPGQLAGGAYYGGPCTLDGGDNGCGQPAANGGAAVETDFASLPPINLPDAWLYPPPQPQTPDPANQTPGQVQQIDAAYLVACAHSVQGCSKSGQAVHVRYIGFTFNVQVNGDALDSNTLKGAWQDPGLTSALFHGAPSWYIANGFGLVGPGVPHVSANPAGVEGHIDHWGPFNPLHWAESMVSLAANTRPAAGPGVVETCSPVGGCH